MTDYREICRAFYALMRRGQSIDLITLCDELRSAGTLEAVGGLANLARMIDEEHWEGEAGD